ncbi:CPBP family intramembrane glutamic endopeptidase [Ilumatobacter sp.]|uniref:CPBP family intramembrane glutamic endopeptidase n=1 Tax=Ilumatobacter sp. TaxID=1967498 RepID=UPI003B51FA8A
METAPPPRSPWGPPTTPPGEVDWSRHAVPIARAERAPHPTLPLAAGAGALVVLVVSLLGSKVVLDLLVDRGWPVVVYVALLAVAGYGPSLMWWWYASRRWGTGRRWRDVGVVPRWSDIGWGPVVWFATVAIQVVVGAIVLFAGVPLANNTDDIASFDVDRTYTVAIVITAVVAAPIVEELVFRGLVMRSLLSKLPALPAIGLQGILFGVAHVDPVRGAGNIGLAIVLSAVGTSFGGAAYLLRRIGPTMVAHALFNGIVMILLLTGIRDRIIEQNPDVFDDLGSVVEQVAVVDQPHLAEPHGGGDPHEAR